MCGTFDTNQNLTEENSFLKRRILDLEKTEIERKRIEEALRDSEERYRQIAEGLSDYLYTVFIRDGQVVETRHRPACAVVTGYTAEEFAADPYLWLHMVIAEDRDQVLEHVHDILSGKNIQPFEHRIMRKDGEIRWVCDTPILHPDSQGRLESYDGVIKDVTERKRAEVEKAKIEAQNQQLQKAESLGRMAGAIAHHFNNQLGVVIGNLEMAIDDMPQDSGLVNNLDSAMNASLRAAEISSLMLTYLGQTPGKREPLDLSEICSQSLPILRAAIPTDVTLESDLPAPGPCLNANANQLRQVLINLVTNAWEAIGKKRGAIRLNVKKVSQVEIIAVNRFPLDWQSQDHAYACLEVIDNGCGIADKDIEKLFDPFYSSKFTGRGLGLPVVLGIVRAHGGAITVESEPERGSAFRVFFLVSDQGIIRQPVITCRGSEFQKGGTVLVVDDEEMVREMAAAMLTRLGFAVLEAKDGVEALEMFRQRRAEIRLVLSDLTMPHMDGWETLTAMRQIDPDVPVILASGYDRAQVMAGDHSELPQAFLGKPYKLKDLSDSICQALLSRNK